jgi:type I restriction enzyme S subunit
MSVVKFSEVAHRANTKEDRFNTDKIYYVGGEHIEPGELFIHDKGVIKGSTIGPMFYCGFKSGQILFVTRNPHLRKCSVAEFDGICSEKTFVIETIDERILLQEYLASVMLSDDFWNYCEENKSGGVNYFLNWSTLADYEFELPSVEEQKAISDKVWAAYRLKESYKKLLAATEEMVKSQFIEMFDGDKYHQMELDSIAEVWLKGQAFKKDNICEEGTNFCIHYGELFTKYGPIIYDVSSTTNDEIMKASKSGDILFPASDVTPDGLARCSAIMRDEVLLGGDIIVLRPKQGNNPEYLSWAINMQKEQLLKRVTGSVVRHMSAKGLKTVQIPIAPIDKQKQFIKIVKQADKSGFIGLMNNRNIPALFFFCRNRNHAVFY